MKEYKLKESFGSLTKDQQVQAYNLFISNVKAYHLINRKKTRECFGAIKKAESELKLLIE